MSWGKFFKVVGKVIAAANVPAPRQRPKSFPVMTMEMIDSKGEPITKAQAVKLFKQYMVAVGYLDKDELTEHAGYFADEMTEHEDCLKQDAAGDLASLKEHLKTLRSRRKGETDRETKADLDDEISSAQDDIENEEHSTESARSELADFKKDKRLFLINYVNQQVQSQ